MTVSTPRISLVCEDVDEEGAGLCRLAPAAENASSSAETDVAFHVPGVLPGERCTATVTHRSPHKREGWASLEVLVHPSPARTTPACPAHGACGGCVLAHWSYDAQVEWKHAQVRALVARTSHLPAAALRAAVASPRPLGYRNKTKLVVAHADDGLRLGAYRPRTHQVVDLAGCQVHEPAVAEATEVLRAVLRSSAVVPFDETTGRGDLRHLVVRGNARGETLLVAVARTAESEGARFLAQVLPTRLPGLRGIVLNVNPARGNEIFAEQAADRTLWGEASLLEDLGEVRLRVSARAFFQANRDVATEAYARIAAEAEVRAGDRVVDAYCGLGGIGLTLGRAGAVVCGIEEHAAATTSAAEAARENGVLGAHFLAGDVAAHLGAFGHADIVVLNPPRKGCEPAVLAAAARAKPRLIAYLSCRPTTLLRDLVALAAHGYRLTSLTPLDMLPQTPHIEALAFLRPARGA